MFVVEQLSVANATPNAVEVAKSLQFTDVFAGQLMVGGVISRTVIT